MLNKESTRKIEQMISDGWQVYLGFGDDGVLIWECDFTRKLPRGGYDNHLPGGSEDINEAVNQAYQNILDGKRR